MKRFALLSLLLTMGVACGGGNNLPTGPSPITAEIDFRYSLAGAASGLGSQAACSGPIRLHPSFWGFAPVTLVAVEPGVWEARFEEVPIGRHTARLETDTGCAGGELAANGVVLSRGSSVTGFAVATDGSLVP